jgi:protein TonB
MEAPPEVGVAGGVPGGIPGGVLSSLLGGPIPGTSHAVAAPPPALVAAGEPDPEPVPPKRIKVAADVQEAQLLVMIRPDYPRTAKMARIQGVVHLTAVIDREGKITELKVREGHPLLASAALTAVGKWRYRPTLLDGDAVEVTTEIIVNFRLT